MGRPKHLTKTQKGQMARRLVYYCIAALTITAIWAMVVKTIGVFTEFSLDVSDVLTFVGAAFGGELLLLCVKRIFAPSTDITEQEVE